MKNVQVIDGATNCTYSLFAVTERDGTLFYELNLKKRYYPTRKEVEVDSSSINMAQRKLFEKMIAAEQARARVRKKVLARPKKKPGSSNRAREPRAR
jgi:hypothetical protein